MKTVTKTVYRLDELDEDVQERVISQWREDDYYFPWEDEYEASLKAFTQNFPVVVKDWKVDIYRGSSIHAEFTDEPEIAELSGIRLLKHLMTNYFHTLYERKYLGSLSSQPGDNIPFNHPMIINKWLPNKGCYFYSVKSNIRYEKTLPTGVCTDAPLYEPLHDFITSPDDRTFDELLNDCLHTWLKAFEDELTYWNSEEAIREEIKARDIWFNERGDIEA